MTSSQPGTLESARLKQYFPELIIPPVVKELVLDLHDLSIITYDKGPAHMGVVVFERNGQAESTEQTSWTQWRTAVKQYLNKSGRGISCFQPQPPTDIDRLHVKYAHLIDNGDLTINDTILFVVEVSIDCQHPEIMRVEDYDGRTGLGIATEFYTRTLPELAKLIGCRFIVGVNNPNNIEFFIGKIDRVAITQIKPEFILFFFPKNNAQLVESNRTIQFLYPEDKQKYLI